MIEQAIQNLNDQLDAAGLDLKVEPHMINAGFFHDVMPGPGNWLLLRQFGDDKLNLLVRVWSEDETKVFNTYSDLSKTDKKLMKELQKQAEKSLEEKNLVVKGYAERFKAKWTEENCQSHATYLLQKNLPQPDNVFRTASTNDNTIWLKIPMVDEFDVLWNFQTIRQKKEKWLRTSKDKPNKLFMTAGRVKGLFHLINTEGLSDTVYVGEGYATCLAASLITKSLTYCAFSKTNLTAVTKYLVEKFGAGKVSILVDFDGNGMFKNGKNAGLHAAKKIAKKYRVSLRLPAHEGFENVDFADLDECVRKEKLDRVWSWEEIQVLESEIKKEKVNKKSKQKEKDFAQEQPKEEKETPPTEPQEYKTGKLNIKRIGEPWIQPSHSILTRTTGFCDVVPVKRTGGVKYIPNFQDLRLAFDEQYHFRTHQESATIYSFDGKRYNFVEKVKIENFAEMHLNPAPKNQDCAEFFGAVKRFRLTNTDFFNPEKKINFNNGWLDIEALTFSPHSADIGFKHVLGYDFDETAECPQFDQFLKRVFLNDPEMERMVLEFLGYALSGDECWAGKALLLKGDGSNGKSTLIKVVRELIGLHNICAAKISEFSSPYSRQRLDGKLLNIAEETPKEALLDSSVFKDIVTGGTLEVRAIYGSPYDLEVRAKVLFSCNDLPIATDSSHAFARRLLIVPFKHEFSEDEADPFIAGKLLKELPGIFNRALFAYFDLKKRMKFLVPESSKAELFEYKETSSPVFSWVAQNCLVLPFGGGCVGKESEIDAMYMDFKTWSESRGYRLINIENFAKNLYRAVPKSLDRRQRQRLGNTDSSRVRILIGVVKKNGQPYRNSTNGPVGPGGPVPF